MARSRHKSWLMALLSTAVVVLLLPLAPLASALPPGNNGTVKIDGIPFDSYPDNQPHVGCIFQVDFYGFDQGNLYATVKFAAQPPTGRDVLLNDDKVFIGEDAAGGGTDLDASKTYNLSSELLPFMRHPTQGYYVKLTVKAQGSIGADTKYKTFWIDSCLVS